MSSALRAASRRPPTSRGSWPGAPSHFKGLLARAKPLPEFLLDDLQVNVPQQKKSEFASRAARIILRCPPLEQETFRKRMAEALGAGARTVQQILAQARKGPGRWVKTTSQSREPSSPMVVDDLRFRWGERGLEKVEVQEIEGQSVERSKVVSNFLIRIVREAEVIDDLRNRREFECRLLLAGDGEDDPGRPVRIEAGNFGSHMRLAEALAAAGNWDLIYSMKEMDFIRMVSSAFSAEKGVSRVRTVRYVGYARTEDGEELGYVTPSVVIQGGKTMPASKALESGGLRCELPAASFKSVKRLDLIEITPEERDATLRHIVADLLRFRGPEIGRSFIGHTFLAPVFGWLQGFKPYVLAILGNSGLGKSTLAGYMQAFFGPRFTDLDLESWTATPKAIELAGHTYKDALYVVDDFKLGHFTQNTLRDAMRVLQGYADGAGRDRLSRASTMMPSAYIRGMLAITGEDLPEGQSSNLARIVPLRVPDTPVTAELTAVKRRCDERRRFYAGVMAHYIAWTQRKGGDYISERAHELYETFARDPAIERVVADNKARVLQNLTLNLLGFVLWAEFTGESGVLDEPAAQRMVQAHFEFLRTVFHSHVIEVSDERPFVLFLRHVLAMVESEVRLRRSSTGASSPSPRTGAAGAR
ncbi:MAG: hypothetical protein ACYTKD_32055 [Planctomycetota bacterium]|jgi:hypothetical protein